MHKQAPQLLLFDLGGVLIDFDFKRTLAEWSRYSTLPLAELQQAFHFDEQYQQYERGAISLEEYFVHVAATLKLDATHAQIEAGWNDIFVGEIVETRQLVEHMRRLMPCHAFTNTNASHMDCWMRLYPGVAQAFDSIFASHQIGLRKPERAAFEHICNALAVAPEAILFFDDLLENVEAARAAGLQGVHVRSPQDVEAALREAGCVSDAILNGDAQPSAIRAS